MKNFHQIKLGEVIDIKVGEDEQLYYVGVFGCYKNAGESEDFIRCSQEAALGLFTGNGAINIYEIANVKVTIKAGRTGGLKLGSYYFETNYIEPGYDANPDVIDHLLAGKKKILARIYHSFKD